ncbi:MAG TPA: hypothetical protein VKE41_10420 [Roseiflexaceae bacterium]|nr:hypothetical protein [Roseiflexaceae bacterium]
MPAIGNHDLISVVRDRLLKALRRCAVDRFLDDMALVGFVVKDLVLIEGLMPNGKEIAECEIALLWRFDMDRPRCVVGMERAQIPPASARTAA